MRPVHLDPLINAEAAAGLEEEVFRFAAQRRRLPAVLQPELFIRVRLSKHTVSCFRSKFEYENVKRFSCFKVDKIPGKIGNLIFKLYQEKVLSPVLWIRIRYLYCFVTFL
jgi:hypothetical protein